MLLKYVQAALRHAKYEILPDDGTYCGEIPECKGAYANAATLEDCREQLREGKHSLTRGKLSLRGAKRRSNLSFYKVKSTRLLRFARNDKVAIEFFPRESEWLHVKRWRDGSCSGSIENSLYLS